jgi:hypothetical protein
MSGEIMLYRALASRAFPVLWLLEEMGLGYHSEIISLRDWRRPQALLRLTPSVLVQKFVGSRSGRWGIVEAEALD